MAVDNILILNSYDTDMIQFILGVHLPLFSKYDCLSDLATLI